MKRSWVAIFFAVLMTSFSVFADDNPVLVKTSGGGYMHPAYQSYETCRVFKDKILIEKHFGSAQIGNDVVMTQVVPVSFQGNLENMIVLAQSEPLQKTENGMCDGPATVIMANLAQESVTLYSTGGCGTDKEDRSGPNSSHLKKIIDAYCLKTY